MKTRSMKKVRFVGLGMVLCILMTLVAFLRINPFSAFATTSEDIIPHSVETLSKELFGDLKIKSSEYLYSFDDSADFIYVDYESYGYAVFLASTLEILEFSPTTTTPTTTHKNTTQKTSLDLNERGLLIVI